MSGGNREFFLEQISSQKPQLVAGIQAISRDEVVFGGFKRALVALSSAQDTTWLLKAEAALQVMINEIIDLNHRESDHMNDAKAAMYLSTLQDLILSLGSWKFENGKENDYVPEITRKFNEVLMDAVKLGIDPAVVQDMCFNKEYKNKNNDDPYWSNFELLDEKRIKNTKLKLMQYESTNNSEIFNNAEATLSAEAVQPEMSVNANEAGQQVPDAQPENNNVQEEYRDHGVVQCQDSSKELVDKVIGIVKTKWGSEKVNYDYIINNLGEFVDVVDTIVPLNSVAGDNQKRIAKLVKMITDRVYEYDQLKAMESTSQTMNDMTVGG